VKGLTGRKDEEIMQQKTQVLLNKKKSIAKNPASEGRPIFLKGEREKI